VIRRHQLGDQASTTAAHPAVRESNKQQRSCGAYSACTPRCPTTLPMGSAADFSVGFDSDFRTLPQRDSVRCRFLLRPVSSLPVALTLAI
jgi:hypothetical protein